MDSITYSPGNGRLKLPTRHCLSCGRYLGHNGICSACRILSLVLDHLLHAYSLTASIREPVND